MENRFTAEGRVLHKKADAARSETRDGVRITRGLPVHSFKRGLYGVCDVVQFQPPEFARPARMSLAKQIEKELNRGTRGGTDRDEVRTGQTDSLQAQVDRTATSFAHWTITPVEYKRGNPKSNDCDRVQLCAQAVCLEEMLNVDIPCGVLFYGQKQRRTEVRFDQRLRKATADAAERLHELIQSQRTPQAFREKKCETCSLLFVCLPPRRVAALFWITSPG